MKIYTRVGDAGSTSLLGGERVRKDEKWIEAYGTVDELNAFLGMARSAGLPETVDVELSRVQAELFDVGALLASRGVRPQFQGPDAAAVDRLEHAIDAMEAELEPLRNFILPGGASGGAALHVARTVCRRAERFTVSLLDEAEGSAEVLRGAIRYLNRLSDFLFVAARYANHVAGCGDVPWVG